MHFCEQKFMGAIKRQSFKVRKNQFEKIGEHVNVMFMRRGAAGDWRKFLDERTLQRIKKAHGPVMFRLGYNI